MTASGKAAWIDRIVRRSRVCERLSCSGFSKFLPLLLCALLVACGGGGGGGSTAPVADICDGVAQKEWVLDQVQEWYLFPETLPANVNLASFGDAQELLDYLTQEAREQGRDRFFSYLTTKAEDTGFLQEGQFIGYGFGLVLLGTSVENAQLFVRFSFEESPADLAGFLRGDEILAIDDGTGFRSVTTILVGGTAALQSALGPAEQGVRRGFRWRQESVDQEAYLTQDIVTIVPIPETQGAAILPLEGTPGAGYLQLLSFIGPAETPLREAFFQFRQQGITDFIIDLRYNGGGLVSIAELMSNLMGMERTDSDVFSRIEFNEQHASLNAVIYFTAQPESVAPLRIAFITTGWTASASELVINSLKPYAQVAIVGSDTFGKPVGQIGLQMEGCDTLLRLVSFRMVNSLGEGDYYNGLAETLPGAACTASDDLNRLPGDPDEGSTQAALAWLSSGTCQSPMSAPAFEDLIFEPLMLELQPRPRSTFQDNMPGVH